MTKFNRNVKMRNKTFYRRVAAGANIEASANSGCG
jgi:hypothetical protein